MIFIWGRLFFMAKCGSLIIVELETWKLVLNRKSKIEMNRFTINVLSSGTYLDRFKMKN